jgi:drug/metabolite transporter (DMT)-like permease
MTPLTLLGFLAVVSCTVAANVLLKTGAMAPVEDRIIFGVLGWVSFVGLSLLGVGGLIYAVLLRRIPLNVAQAFSAMQFIGVILAARVVLGEPISALRWLGIGLTCAGVIVVGATARG